jgi:hypothetical protein
MERQTAREYKCGALYIIAVLIAIVVVIGLLYSREPEKDKDYISSDAVKRAMKYHGIYSLTVDLERKEAYFYRDGQRVMVTLPPEEYRRVR